MKRRVLVILGALIVSAIAAFALRMAVDSPDQPQDAPYDLSITAYPRVLSPEQAVVASDTAALGVVEKVSDSTWTTSDGKMPPNFEPAKVPSAYFIYRTAYVRVTSSITNKSGRTSDLIPVRVMGGTVDGFHIGFDDFGPQLEVGQNVLLFLNPPEGLDATDWVPIEYFRIEKGIGKNDHQADISVDVLLQRVQAAAVQAPVQ